MRYFRFSISILLFLVCSLLRVRLEVEPTYTIIRLFIHIRYSIIRPHTRSLSRLLEALAPPIRARRLAALRPRPRRFALAPPPRTPTPSPPRRSPTAWRVRLRCRRREDSSAAAGGATGRAGPRPARAGSRTRPGPTLLPLISAAARVGSRRPATSPGSRSRSHPAPLPAPVRESWPTATGSSLPAPVRRSPGSTAATATARTWRRCSPVHLLSHLIPKIYLFLPSFFFLVSSIDFLASSFCRLISWLHLFSGFILLQMLVSLILISCLILFLFLSFYSFFLAWFFLWFWFFWLIIFYFFLFILFCFLAWLFFYFSVYFSIYLPLDSWIVLFGLFFLFLYLLFSCLILFLFLYFLIFRFFFYWFLGLPPFIWNGFCFCLISSPIRILISLLNLFLQVDVWYLTGWWWGDGSLFVVEVEALFMEVEADWAASWICRRCWVQALLMEGVTCCV